MNLFKKSMSVAMAALMAGSALSMTGITAFAAPAKVMSGVTLNTNGQALSVTEGDKMYTRTYITQAVTTKTTAFTADHIASGDNMVDGVAYPTYDEKTTTGINDTYTYFSLSNVLGDSKMTVTLAYNDGTTNVVKADNYQRYDILDAAGNNMSTVKATWSTNAYNLAKDNHYITSYSDYSYDYTKMNVSAQSKYVINGVTCDNTLKAGNTYTMRLYFGDSTFNTLSNRSEYQFFVDVPVTINHAATSVTGAKAATYWKTGFTGNTVCTDCGNIVTAGKTIAKKAATLSTVKSSKKKTLKATYKKVSGATGYQIQASTSKKFSKKTTVKVKGSSKTSATVSKLSSKKKYYVRVRAYKKSGSKTYYSTWSKVKSVKTK